MHSGARRFAACLGLVFVAHSALAQSAADAQKLFDAEQWGPAAEAYSKVVAADPKNGDAWFHLGVAERNLERYAESVAALEKAMDNGFLKMRCHTALGITRAQAGDTKGAFHDLDLAVDQGLPAQVLETHPGLAPLRDDPRMAALRKKAQEKSRPCEHDARYRAFDFWVGDWDVYQGAQQIGHNRIEKILAGCALQENWTDGYGSSGKSLNYFDPAAGKWKQNWVDETGGVVWYEGEVKDGEMRYAGENIAANGTKQLTHCRLTPMPDGTVHHVIETSADGGKTWSKGFDAIYRPAKKEATGPR